MSFNVFNFVKVKTLDGHHRTLLIHKQNVP